ncbi:MAG: DUF2834 domain-containing protein [Cyanobacteria bacterium Co-bin8]|nr:DUF2834 domain-containing protein [Cyanobacteria bacterium Co-bin8]
MMRFGLSVLWISVLVYAFVLAPPNQPGTADLIVRLSVGDWDGINPAVSALFSVMGIWPMIYAAIALIDGHQQQAKAWPFVVASFGTGAFAILPYLIWRSPNPTFTGAKTWLLKLLDSRWLGLGLLLASLGLVAFGLIAGDWSDFWQQWRTSRFIHVASLDFCLLWGLFPVLLGDDMARRGLKQPAWFWVVVLLPLIGAAAYLTLRPPLPEEQIGLAETPV